MNYWVERMERHAAIILIEAESIEDAIKKVKDDEGDEQEVVYVETMDSDTWNVFEEVSDGKNCQKP
jgi:hypothetical protein